MASKKKDLDAELAELDTEPNTPKVEVIQPPPPAAAATPAAAKPKRWRVAQTARCSLFGQLIVLEAGDVIDEAGYPPGAVQRLLDCGVKLEAA